VPAVRIAHRGRPPVVASDDHDDRVNPDEDRQEGE
jgi:hypothetical protein